MSDILTSIIENKPVVIAAAVGAAGVFWWWRVRARQEPRGPRPPANWQRDVVYLYMFPRCSTKQVVNLSPFGMKVETWLRLNKIKYEVVETLAWSPERKQIPYIWLNGAWVEDSYFIIRHLTSHFNLDETEGLTEAERGVLLAFTRMTESHTAKTIFHYRYLTNMEAYERVFRMAGDKQTHSSFTPVFTKEVKKWAWYHGIGRYTEEERTTLGLVDFTAISDFLDNKPYLMGDKMTSVDCCVFGHLCQVVLVDMPFPQKAALKGKGQNLVDYIHRIKDRLWPDWADLCDVNGRFQ